MPHSYTFGVTATTIKVSSQTRDRLKAQAAAAHVSLGEHLTRLADAADREARFAGLRQAIADMPPEVAASHRQETEAWEATELIDARDA